MGNSKGSYKALDTFHYFSERRPMICDFKSKTRAAAYTFVSFLLVKVTRPVTG
jgi:hypothetical protein